LKYLLKLRLYPKSLLLRRLLLLCLPLPCLRSLLLLLKLLKLPLCLPLLLLLLLSLHKRRLRCLRLLKLLSTCGPHHHILATRCLQARRERLSGKKNKRVG
jgi:hypothetical protein